VSDGFAAVRRKGRQLVAVGALVVAAVGCGGAGGDEPKPLPVPGEAGFLYDVHGDLLYLQCAGRGTPTVVLEAGLGDDHRAWDSIEPGLARTTRVCSYDRSGLSFSANARKRANALEKVDNLHDLLDIADEHAPYVLVGHSFGGLLVQMYATTHVEEVAGMVLLDSSHSDQIRRFLAALPPRRKGESRELSELRAQLEVSSNDEGVDFRKSLAQAGAVRSLGDIPLIVVTAGESDFPLGSPFARQFERVWRSLQDDLAKLSNNTIHVIATYSPHYVMSHLGQPELVVRAVGEVIAAVRSNRRLRQCDDVFAPGRSACLPSP
jgi:pimeloyl-ACP methyl ester carboxylesterase